MMHVCFYAHEFEKEFHMDIEEFPSAYLDRLACLAQAFGELAKIILDEIQEQSNANPRSTSLQ